MQFDLTTFIFEIINFLILIWILQRLFYKPLLEVIAKRKQFIDQTLADAKAIQAQADEQRSLYENRQKAWEQEKQSAMNALNSQLELEKAAAMRQLTIDLEAERQKHTVTQLHKLHELEQQAEKQALTNAAKFASLLLKQAATPELETRLFDLLLSQLTALPKACQHSLQSLSEQQDIPIQISSAYPLTTEQHEQLQQQLSAQIHQPIRFDYQQNPELIAGVRIDIGAWVLNANLQHELLGFAQFDDDFE
ncbi:MAG: F0F1 ATP synthase subunit delta [Methylococcaceae bacterium]|nr:F0F1 ATP synthase subunit delta [Methylococcaceae bacterium]